jgi:hypothetical protein
MGGSELGVSIARGMTDQVLEQIKRCLETYLKDHASAEISLYRQNSVSVRVRIIDPQFDRMSRADRSDLVWNYFDSLSDEVQSDISMLVLLTPSEVRRSMANLEFEDPVPSLL